tara:strand:+ start:6310 stop:7308 length:999 start_codon:yes stop_codon:yes gene_type:complete
MKHSRFLIIGSNSFSGASFIKHLLKDGHEVMGVSRSKEPDEVFLPYTEPSNASHNFHFYPIDLNHDLSVLVKLVDDYQPQYVVNFSAQGMVAESWLNPKHWYQTNMLAQVELHDHLRKLKYIQKYIHVSTPEVYGSTSGWIKENLNFAPSTPYAVSRAACDLHLMSFYHAYDFPVIFTRSANVYGPGQQLYRIIPQTMMCARMGQKLQLHGGGNSIRSFIHIDDVAVATMKVAFNGDTGSSYHLSTENTISIRELVQKICDLTNTSFKDLVEETDDRLGKDQSYLLDSSKARNDLEWQDSIALEEGLIETLSWIDVNFNTLKNFPLKYKHKV